MLALTQWGSGGGGWLESQHVPAMGKWGRWLVRESARTGNGEVGEVAG